MKPLNVQIEDSSLERLQELLPWGMRGRVFQAVTDKLCDVLESTGPVSLGPIMEGHFVIKLEYNEHPRSKTKPEPLTE